MERLKNIKRPLLKDKFKKYGDSFELVSKNESNRMYCYRRTTPEGIVYFEVFRSILEKDDNGNVYESYPSTSQFGDTAWCIRDGENAQRKIHGTLFAWCSWILMFKVRNKSLRGLVAAWLCMDAGFFIAAYVNDVMQYPNQLPVYIGFALCFAAPHIDKRISEEENTQSVSTPETDEQI